VLANAFLAVQSLYRHCVATQAKPRANRPYASVIRWRSVPVTFYLV